MYAQTRQTQEYVDTLLACQRVEKEPQGLKGRSMNRDATLLPVSPSRANEIAKQRHPRLRPGLSCCDPSGLRDGNTKFEARNPKQIRITKNGMTKTNSACVERFEHSHV
jgi:hypothetical protein